MLLNQNLGAVEWLENEVENITTTRQYLTPTQHAQAVRYLPASTTPYPGPFDLSLNPFMKEPLDCFDIDSPVREVSIMKGVQITYTTMLECVILYCIDYVKTCPIMFMTADKELAQARIENNILPMINASGLSHLIQSADEGNKRKTGKTKDSLQWQGPGVLYPFGANNADKMRMFSIWFMLKDELDAWPDTVGKDGDPDTISDDRCAAYWEKRKILRGSTPLEDPSKIHRAYLRGDQRVYKVRCRACGFPQALRWSGINKETGHVYGITWKMDGATLDPDSVRYVCSECAHEHEEHDKPKLFATEEGAEWVPTAKPQAPGLRSYHLPAMYSPAGMQPWSKCVDAYLKGYDPERKRVRDFEAYRVFYNNILGEPFKKRGGGVSFEIASSHRREEYSFGEIPNELARDCAGSPIAFLTCTVDVHKDDLAVAVFGWTTEARGFLINYWRFQATPNADSDPDDISTENLDDPATWGRLRGLIEQQEYEADDGRTYRVAITFIDAGYIEETVSKFCSEYDSGVFPILGRTETAKKQKFDEFGEFKTKKGLRGFRLMVNHYKDRMSSSMRSPWDGEGTQPPRTFNAPVNTTDAQIKELTAEYRREVKDKTTGRSMGFEWYRKSGAANELFDLWGYAMAAVDVIAWDLMVNTMELEAVDEIQFWDHIEAEALFYELPPE
jgi:phage terminase large subunit GpA-like protein